MVLNHVIGLFSHPTREMQKLSEEKETVTHLYTHHILLLAAIPVICSFIGTTQVGWQFKGEVIKLSYFSAAYVGIISYLLMLAGVAVVGEVIYLLARHYPQRPDVKRCLSFAGHTATPMFMSGLIALYPLPWLCLLVGIVGVYYSAYLLFVGIPNFLKINYREGFIFSSTTLAIGVLVLEILLAATVLLWAYGANLLF